MKFFPFFTNILDHCHWLIILLLLGVNPHQLTRNRLKSLLHVLAGFGTDFKMDDSALLAKSAYFLRVDFSFVSHIAFVAEDDEADVGNSIFFDLDGKGGTSFSQ